MKTTPRHIPAILLSVLALACLGGCSIVPGPKADPTRHYVLSSTAPQPAPAATAAGAKPAARPVLGLRTVVISDYLANRKNMVVRLGANEVLYNDYARWAETPDSGVARIVRERLLASGAAAAIEPLPTGADRAWDLAIRIIACEGAIPSGPGSAVASFAAEYEFLRPDGTAPAETRRFAPPPAKWDGKNHGELAALLGNAAAALADDIAKNVP